MTITIDQANAADHTTILALMREARGEDLNDEQRARQGFVQGHFNEDMLARFAAASGVFVARDGNTLAGVCMTSLPGMIERGPPAATVTAVQQAVPDIPHGRLFLCGPIAIDRRYQGQSPLTRLLLGACTTLQGRFELGAAFVECSNLKSLAIHRHYPMAESTGFVLDERRYAIFTFSPEQVIERYR